MGLKSWKYDLFQSRNRDTFLFKWAALQSAAYSKLVSISQSRYFSFQGQHCEICSNADLMFQSRNRDTFLFKTSKSKRVYSGIIKFQSRNRDTFLFKRRLTSNEEIFFYVVSISQSRYFSFQGNKPLDVIQEMRLCFNLAIEILFFSRDCRSNCNCSRHSCFNLAIEILFFSRSALGTLTDAGFTEFQSRNRDTFLFKQKNLRHTMRPMTMFQSRNRDTFLFKSDIPLQTKTVYFVSISQSRYFSFQACKRSDTHRHNSSSVSISQSRYFSFQVEKASNCTRCPVSSFNLAIEILFFSSWTKPFFYTRSEVVSFNLAIEILFFSRNRGQAVDGNLNTAFQSCNRDTFLFKGFKAWT